MKLTQFGMFFVFFVISLAHALPDIRNPNFDYELINVAHHNDVKPTTQQDPRPTVVVRSFNTPPPVTDPNSKTFAYDPASKTWTLIKKDDPQPGEDTLLWNQSNDKWLTQTAPA